MISAVLLLIASFHLAGTVTEIMTVPTGPMNPLMSVTTRTELALAVSLRAPMADVFPCSGSVMETMTAVIIQMKATCSIAVCMIYLLFDLFTAAFVVVSLLLLW